MARSIIQDLTVGSVPKKLIRFALPFMFSTLLQTAYSMVDMMVVGQFVGSKGLSAVSIASQLMWLTTALCMGFTNAGQIIISQIIGAGRRQDLKKTIGTVTTTIVVAAAFITVLGLCLTEPILRALSTPAESFGEAARYLRIAFLGTVFTFGYNLVSAVLRGMGDSRHPLIFVAISAGANLILDLIAVALLHWGAAGAALATVLGQGISLVISLRYLYGRREEIGFDFKLASLKPDGATLRKLIRLGIPFALQHAAISISMLFVTRFINTYGLTASSTFGTGTKIEQLPWIVVNGVMVACATMVGQNMGAGKQDRMKQTVRVGAFICAGTAAVFIALFLLIPRELYSFFTSDPDVLEMAPMFMLALALSTPATTMMCPYQAFIEGIGNAALTMIIALLDGFVSRIAISLFLAYVCKLGLMGWFLGYGLAAYVNTILSVIYYYGGFWKKRVSLASV